MPWSRAAEVAGTVVAALTLRPAAREALEQALARFAATIARAGLEANEARRLLRESLVAKLLARAPTS